MHSKAVLAENSILSVSRPVRIVPVEIQDLGIFWTGAHSLTLGKRRIGINSGQFDDEISSLFR